MKQANRLESLTQTRNTSRQQKLGESNQMSHLTVKDVKIAIIIMFTKRREPCLKSKGNYEDNVTLNIEYKDR